MLNDYSENLKKGMILVFAANLINLIISLMNGFILPKYLSVNTYANIKTYQLYANYIGVLALGYSDGIYLHYGGTEISKISNNEINIYRTNLVVFQGILSLVFIVLACFINDVMLLFAAVTIVPVNVVACFKNILQATGEFKAYSRIMNYTSMLTFVGTVILLFIIKTDNANYYVLIMAIVTFIVWALMERNMKKSYGFNRKFILSFRNIILNIKSGIILMLGNFSSILLTGIDRWFVKILLTNIDFAYYSFVVSAENLVAVFINPVVTTMYNYICVTEDYEKINKIKRMCMIFALFLISGAFIIKFILEIYLDKYLLSNDVLFILFATEVFFIMIKGIYVNVYKACKKQDIYLKQLVEIIVLSGILNTVLYVIVGTKEGIAFATLISVTLWYIVCCLTVKELMPTWKDNLTLIICIPAFILLGLFTSALIGFIIYIILVLLICMIFYYVELKSLVKIVFNMIYFKQKNSV